MVTIDAGAAKAERRARLKTRIKHMVFALIPVTVLVACMEALSTMTVKRTAETIAGARPGDSIYIMRIGSFPWSRESHTALNSKGYPDEELPAAATVTPGCTRVLVSGDSYLFGDGVDGDSSLFAVLKRRALQRADTGCVRFYSIAQRGTTIDQQLQRIREAVPHLQPQLVLLGQYQNDLTDLASPWARAGVQATRPASGEQWTSVQDRSSMFSSNTVRLLTYQVFAGMIRNGMKRDILKRWSVLADTNRREQAARLMSQYEASYDTLVTELSRQGIAFGTVILPSKLDLLAGYYPEEAYYAGLAERRHVPFLRIFPVLNANRTPYPFLLYDGHLNELGNRLVADAIWAWLFESAPAPFPALRG